jgi:PPOX class probable F420-dependent enzyme
MLTADDLRFLDQQRVARLATADAAGRPTAVPVCFVHLAGRLYIPIDAKPKHGDPRRLKRLRNIAQQPAVALLVDRYDDDWTQLRWLLIRAQAAVLDDHPDRQPALAALEARYPQYAAMGLAGLGLPLIVLQPSAVSRWAWRPPGQAAS